MKIRHYLAIGIGLLCILGASFFLIPGKRELALMHLKDKDYEVARRLYATQSIGDNLPVSVVVPLTELYLQNADVPSAVALMERFVRKHPDNLSALRRLGQLYRYAQRPEEALANLEKICSLQPTVDELRDLSNIYNFTSQYGKQIATLKKLLKVQPGNPQNFLDLSYLQASQGLIAQAAQTMEEFEARHPMAVNDNTTELRLSLMLDSGKAGKAFDQAAAWISQHRDPEMATRLASLLHFKRQPALALRLLESLEDLISKNPPLLAQLVELQTALGQSEKAYARLRGLLDSDKLPDDVSPTFINLCLMHGDLATAIAVAQRGPLDRLPEWLVMNLGDMALASKRHDFAHHMLATLGEGFFRSHPVLAARLASALGDRSAVERWIKVAEQQQGLPIDQIIGLANLYVTLGERNNALRHLSRIAENPDTPNSALHDLARLYIEAGEASKGLSLFEKLRKLRRSTDINADWALLAASTGAVDPVVAWLQSKETQDVDPQILKDLYYISEKMKVPNLTVAAAERLCRIRPSRREKFMLGRALVAAHRPIDALPYLRPLLPGSQEEESAYIDALTAVAGQDKYGSELCDFLARKLAEPGTTQGHREDLVRALLELRDYKSALPAAADLARKAGGAWLSLYIESAVKAGQKKTLLTFLQAELERPDLSAAEKQERLYVLLDNGGTAEALPHLRNLAEKLAGEWFSAYEEALLKLNRREELYAAWTKRLSRQDTTPAEKREIAYRALEAGQKGIAEAVFRTLANVAPADSPDVAQLLYLWGPRPSSSALEWIESRVLASPDEEFSGWMQHLLNAGGAKRAAVVARNHLPPPGQGGPVLEACLAGLLASGDKMELSRTLEREIATDRNIQRLRRYSRLALDINRTPVAQNALLKILSVAPNDSEALRQLGSLAISHSNYALAQSYLSRYLASGDGDYESNYYFGELMLRQGKHEPARTYFQRSLQQISSKESPALAARIVQAKLLFRLGRNREALAAAENLIAEQQGDKNLRADLVAAMLDAGLLEDAKRYLKIRTASNSTPLAASMGTQSK